MAKKRVSKGICSHQKFMKPLKVEKSKNILLIQVCFCSDAFKIVTKVLNTVGKKRLISDITFSYLNLIFPSLLI